MLNPSLINRTLDGEDYENAAPTLGTLMICRFSAPEPERHSEVVYSADGLFFATYSRRIYLRPAMRNEFDIYTSEVEYSERPTLWVSVTLLAPGYHVILPVWRGRAFWNGTESDTDQGVAELLIQMSLRGGLSIAEWYAFICDQRAARKANSKATKAKAQVIH